MTKTWTADEIKARKIELTQQQIGEVFEAFETKDGISTYHQIRGRPGAFSNKKRSAEISRASVISSLGIDLFNLYDDQKPWVEEIALHAAGLDNEKNLEDPAYLNALAKSITEKDASKNNRPINQLAFHGAMLLEMMRQTGHEFTHPIAQKWIAYQRTNGLAV